MAKKKASHKLKELFINEVSPVLAGANPLADMLIAKTRGRPTQKLVAQAKDFVALDEETVQHFGAEVLDLIAKEGAMTFDEAREAQERDEQVSSLLDRFYQTVWALRSSLRSIFEDADLTDNDRAEAIQSSLQGFQRAVSESVQGIVAVLEDDEEEDESVDDDESTSEEEISSQAKGVPMAKNKADTLTLEQLQTANDELKTDLQKALVLAELDDVQKAHLSRLGESEQETFLSLSPQERVQAAKKTAQSDETLEVGDRIVRKSAVGEEAFEALKAQQVQITEEIEKRAVAEYQQKAEADYPYVPGTPVEKGQMLRAVARLEKTERDAVEGMLAAYNDALKALGKPVGHQVETEPPKESGVMKTLKSKYGKKDE